MNQEWPAKPGVGSQKVFPYEYIMRCTETSLRNLQVDSIDLQQLHVWNPDWFHNDDWRRAFDELKTSGKVRAVGVSINDHQPDSALELVQSGLIDSVQVIYNVFDQSPEKNLFPLTQKMNVGVLARVPFDEGSLTGAITESSTFQPGDFRWNISVGIAENRWLSTFQPWSAISVSLTTPWPKSPCVSPSQTPRSHQSTIPGMRTVRNVERNAAASDQGPLDPDALKILKRHAWDRNFYD